MTKDLISRLRKTAKHSYLGRLLLEEAADCMEGLQAERDAWKARAEAAEAVLGG